MIDFMINTKLPPVAGKFGNFLKATVSEKTSGGSTADSAKLLQKVYGLSVTEFEALWHTHLGVK